MRSLNFMKPMSILGLTAALLLAACGPDGGEPNASAPDGGALTRCRQRIRDRSLSVPRNVDVRVGCGVALM